MCIQRFFVFLALIFTMVPFVFCYDEGGNKCIPAAIAVCDKLCAMNKELRCTVDRNKTKCTMETFANGSQPCSVEDVETCKSLQSFPLGCQDEYMKCECYTTSYRTNTCNVYTTSDYDYCTKQELYSNPDF